MTSKTFIFDYTINGLNREETHLHATHASQPPRGATNSGQRLYFRNQPYDQTVIGNVTVAQADHTHLAIETAIEQKETLTRYQRFEILDQSRRELLNRKEEFRSNSSPPRRSLHVRLLTR